MTKTLIIVLAVVAVGDARGRPFFSMSARQDRDDAAGGFLYHGGVEGRDHAGRFRHRTGRVKPGRSDQMPRQRRGHHTAV